MHRGYNLKMDESYSSSDDNDSKAEKRGLSAAQKSSQLPDMWSQGSAKKDGFFMFGSQSGKDIKTVQTQLISKLSNSELSQKLRRQMEI